MENDLRGSGPVTVVVRHTVKPGLDAEFEEWLRNITREMLRFEGQQGYNVIRPAGNDREYLVFFRFDTFEHLEKWESSPERRRWLEQLESFSANAPSRERHTGLEVWFSPRPGRVQPPRWKMVLVTLLAIYPLISLVQLLVIPYLPDLPVLVRTMITSTLLVCVMSYIVMPAMTRIFSRWLYGVPA